MNAIFHIEKNRAVKISRCVFRVTGPIILIALGVVVGFQLHRGAGDAPTNPLGDLLQSFAPAVLFAAGHGMRVPDFPDVPELNAFLNGETSSFDLSVLPDSVSGAHIFQDPPDAFILTHWLLFYAVGWCWRLFGVSYASLHILVALFFGAALWAAYFVFRLGMGRTLSWIGATAFLLLPPALHVSSSLRDFSKAPFVLLTLALVGRLLLKRRSVGALLSAALAAGWVAGVGYGFRQDMLVCLPVLAAAFVFAPVRGGYRPAGRLLALCILMGVFAVLALPVAKGVGYDSGSVSSHTLFQGLSREVERSMDFGEGRCILLQTPNDAETHATVNVHARFRGNNEPMPLYLSPAYGRAGRALFREWALTFPADLFARGLASMETIPRLASLTESLGDYQNADLFGMSPYLKLFHQGYRQWVEPCALFFIGMAAFALVFRFGRYGWGMLLVMAYFMAYPNLLFQVRHAFHLSFVTLWAVLFCFETFFWSLPVHGYRLYKRRRRLTGDAKTSEEKKESAECAERSASEDSCMHNGNQTIAWRFCTTLLSFVLVAVSLVFVLQGLRYYQCRQTERLAEQYEKADRTPLEWAVQEEEDYCIIFPKTPLPSLQDSWNLPIGDAAAACLAISFEDLDHPIPITLRYRAAQGADFTREVIVPAPAPGKSDGMYCFPVYAFADFAPFDFMRIKHQFPNSPLVNFLVHRWGINAFEGIVMRRLDGKHLKDIHYIERPEELPWLIYGSFEDSRRGCKHIRLEKELAAWTAMLPYWINGDATLAIEKHFQLLVTFSEYEGLVRRTEKLLNRMDSPGEKAGMLERFGALAPDHAGEIAQQLAQTAEELRHQGSLAEAEHAYRAATEMAPKDRWHRVKLAEVLDEQGRSEEARSEFAAVVRAAPESPYSAERFDALCTCMGKTKERFDFWNELHRRHSDRLVPMLRLGRALEQRGEAMAAAALYERGREIHGEHARWLLMEGALAAAGDSYSRGRALMDEALEKDADLMPYFLDGLAHAAAHYAAAGGFTFAEAIYQELLNRAPDRMAAQLYYGETLLAMGVYDAAREVFKEVLQEQPERVGAADMLDACCVAEDQTERCLDVWRDIAEDQPHAVLPYHRLGSAHKRSGNWREALASFCVALRNAQLQGQAADSPMNEGGGNGSVIEGNKL